MTTPTESTVTPLPPDRAPGNLMTRTQRVLLVEDNPGDVRLTQELLGDAQHELTLDYVANGLDALAYLKRQGRFRSAPQPDLVLLDLNIPKKSGLDVLAEVKSDPNLVHIPIVVVTNADDPEKIRGAYQNHANAVVRKPLKLSDYVDLVRVIEDFWLRRIESGRNGSTP